MDCKIALNKNFNLILLIILQVKKVYSKLFIRRVLIRNKIYFVDSVFNIHITNILPVQLHIKLLKITGHTNLSLSVFLSTILCGKLM